MPRFRRRRFNRGRRRRRFRRRNWGWQRKNYYNRRGNRATNYGSLAKFLKSRVQVKLSKIQSDFNPLSVPFDPDLSGSAQIIPEWMDQGTADDQRTGKYVKIHKGKFWIPVEGPTEDWLGTNDINKIKCRMIAAWIHRCDGTPILGDILHTNNINSGYNVQSDYKYKIIKDKTFYLGANELGSGSNLIGVSSEAPTQKTFTVTVWNRKLTFGAPADTVPANQNLYIWFFRDPLYADDSVGNPPQIANEVGTPGPFKIYRYVR